MTYRNELEVDLTLLMFFNCAILRFNDYGIDLGTLNSTAEGSDKVVF